MHKYHFTYINPTSVKQWLQGPFTMLLRNTMQWLIKKIPDNSFYHHKILKGFFSLFFWLMLHGFPLLKLQDFWQKCKCYCVLQNNIYSRFFSFFLFLSDYWSIIDPRSVLVKWKLLIIFRFLALVGKKYQTLLSHLINYYLGSVPLRPHISNWYLTNFGLTS